MSLTWHIVRKDLRRLRLPLGLWLLLVLAHTALLAAAPGGGPASGAAFEGLGYFSFTWGAIVGAVGFLLAAWLVMEDNLVDEQAFWPTRPIRGARLLAAKAAGAILMFSVAPVLVLTPVWLACGFSGSQLARAAGTLAATQGLFSLMAFVVAVAVRTSGQFLMVTVVTLVVVPGSAALGDMLLASAAVPAGLALSRAALARLILVLAPLLLIGHQYLTRRTQRTWAIGLAGVALLLTVRLGWNWDISALVYPGRANDGPETEVTRTVEVTSTPQWVEGSTTPPERRQLRLRGMASGLPADAYLRVNGTFAEWSGDGPSVPLFRRLRPPATPRHHIESLGLQIAGLLPPRRTNEPLALEGDDLRVWTPTGGEKGRTLHAALDLTLMRGRVVGELPLRIGAELRGGVRRARIIGIERDNDTVQVRLAERDFGADARFVSLDGPPSPPGERGREAADVFVLVNRALNHHQVLPLRLVGAVQINSILVGQRELTIRPPERAIDGRKRDVAGWETDAVIVQVRFEPEHHFVRHVKAGPFAATAGDQPANP